MYSIQIFGSGPRLFKKFTKSLMRQNFYIIFCVRNDLAIICIQLKLLHSDFEINIFGIQTRLSFKCSSKTLEFCHQEKVNFFFDPCLQRHS